MRLLTVLLVVAIVLSGGVSCREEPPVTPAPPLALLERSHDGAVEASQPISLSFSQPLPSDYTLSVSPEAGFSAHLADDHSILVISPVQAWSYDTEYVVVVEGLEYGFYVAAEPRVVIFAGGDVLLDKRPGEQIRENGPEVVFQGLAKVLEMADIRFANLENPISVRGEPVQKNFRFRSPPETVAALTAARFDVLSFTNNHTFDFGLDAFLDTLDYLDQAGIQYAGVGRNRADALQPVIIEEDGIKVAFLAFMQRTILPVWSPPLWEAGDDKPGVVFLDGEQGRETILHAVREAKVEADIVLVSLHWGFEGTRAPQEWQRSLARAIIDEGADGVLGHHPHLPFGVETHSGKPIIYSMGNLLFHPYDPEARESFVATITAKRGGISGVTLHPIIMQDGLTALLTGEAADNVLQLITDRSAALGTRLTREGDALTIPLAAD